MLPEIGTYWSCYVCCILMANIIINKKNLNFFKKYNCYIIYYAHALRSNTSKVF